LSLVKPLTIEQFTLSLTRLRWDCFEAVEFYGELVELALERCIFLGLEVDCGA